MTLTILVTMSNKHDDFDSHHGHDIMSDLLRRGTIVAAMELQHLKLSKGLRTCVKTCHPSSDGKKLPPAPNFSPADICSNIRTCANFHGKRNFGFLTQEFVLLHILRKYMYKDTS